MTKTIKKSVAFMSAAVMVMAMLLYFPGGFFSNIDWGLTASAANDITPKEPSTDGSGVYQIGTAGELYWFAALVNGDESVCTGDVSQNTAACAELTADITVNSNVLTENGELKSGTFKDWTPIGWYDDYNYVAYPYTGTFDGQNHKISGLYFNDSDTSYVGLFGYVEKNGSVSNVGVVDSYFIGHNYVGGVCGENYAYRGTATITNCYNEGTVTATADSAYVGGVCGDNSAYYSAATITNCYNTGAVTANGDGAYVGGVCGYNSGAYGGTATITNCYNTGSVTANGDGAYVGGVCGYNENGTITNQHVPNYAVRSNVIQPTCTSSGSYTRTTYCKICGQAYKVEKITTDPTGHTPAAAVIENNIDPACGTDGSYDSVVYCSVCNAEISRDTITVPAAEEHDYSSGGICKTCGALKNGRDGFKSASLTLTDGVILNYYLILSDEALADKNAYIHFTSPQGLDKKIMLSDGVETDDRYMFSLELRPDQMADEITAQVVYTDSTVGSSISYSVQKYTESVSETDSIRALADAMLKFGAFTQLYTGNNTGNLPADVKDYEVNASIGNEYKHQLTSNISGISVKGATLEIGAYTTIRVKYQLAQGESISKYTFKCGNTVLEPEKSGDYYYVYLRNIRPQNLDEMYSFTVTDGTNTTTLKYSAFSYMKNILDNPTAYNKNIVNLMNAMYDYNKAAEAYIG